MKKPKELKIVKKLSRTGAVLLTTVFTTLAYVPQAAYVYAEEDETAEAEESTEEEDAEETEETEEEASEEDASAAEEASADETEETEEEASDETAEEEAAADEEDVSADETDEELTEEELLEEELLEEDLPVELTEKELTEEEEAYEEPVYRGITIDGSFSDWDAVMKTDAGHSTEYQDALESVAVIVDDGMVYVYIRDSGMGAAAWSGPHGNGQFSFVSDLGYSTLLQVHTQNNGAKVSVSGVDDAQVAYYTEGWGYDGEWEIAFSADQLPTNKGTFSFGYYMTEPFVTDIADTSGLNSPVTTVSAETDEEDGDFNGIVYDGLYGDWKFYPHTLIQYATSGTWQKYIDGEGALYVNGSRLYGHVETKMAPHLTEHGDEMCYGVVLRINQNDAYWFEFRLVGIGADGSVDWNTSPATQPNGSYEYAIVDTRGWSGAATVEALNDENFGNQIYGYITVTKSEISDEAEWWLDLPMIAEHFGLEETDMKVLEVKYERIGDKWIQTAGASSGPVAGILLSMTAAGSVLFYRKRKGAVCFH